MNICNQIERLNRISTGIKTTKSTIPVVKKKGTSSKNENAIHPHQSKHVRATNNAIHSATVNAYDT